MQHTRAPADTQTAQVPVAPTNHTPMSNAVALYLLLALRDTSFAAGTAVVQRHQISGIRNAVARCCPWTVRYKMTEDALC